MIETPKEAARRFAAPMLAKGYQPVALHAYTDASGDAIYWRIRLKHPETGDKWICPMKLNGQGYELAEPQFNNGKPLYALHRIAGSPDGVVWIVEGEQKADALNGLGLVATTSGGATSAGAADWQPLRNRAAIIWPDNDDPGKAYAGKVARVLLDLGCTVSCIDVDKLGLGAGQDAMEWLAEHPGAARGEIEALPRLLAPDRKNAPAGDSGGRIVFRRASDIEVKPIRWLWRGRIARGKVSMLAGNPGLGKSQVTLSMAAVVTTGGAWPVDGTRCERGNVVILSAEDDAADTIRPRLEAAGADLSRVFILDAVVEGRAGGGEIRRAFNLQADLGRLAAKLAEIGDVALIVIDPITAYLGDVDSHRNAEIRALLAPLSELAAEHGAAVVCVSHLNKNGGGEALMRVTGSLAFVAAPRSAWLVAKDAADETRRLFLSLKNNIGNDRTGLAFAVQSAQVQTSAGLIETSRVAWESEAVSVTADEAMALLGDPEERSAVEDATQFIATLLADGPVRASQIKTDADGAGFNWRTVQRAADRLGVVRHKDGMRGGWLWGIAPKATSHTEGDTQKMVASSALLSPSADDSELIEVEI